MGTNEGQKAVTSLSGFFLLKGECPWADYYNLES